MRLTFPSLKLLLLLLACIFAPAEAMASSEDVRFPTTYKLGWDAQNRVTKKKINSVDVFTYVYETKTSRLKYILDAAGQRTNFEYWPDDRIKRVFYTNATGGALPVATPEVSYTYDARFGRLATMVDATGTTTYSYVPINGADTVYGDGQLASVGGRIAGDTIAYAYDRLGRPTTRSFDGATTTASGYDALGRVTGTVSPLGQFVPTFEGLSGRVDFVQHSVGGVAGIKTDFAWESGGERRLTGIAHSWGAGNAAVSAFGYGYALSGANDPTGQIRQWSQTQGGAARAIALGYDEAEQLTEAVRTEAGGAVSGSWAYQYDKAGNRLRKLENGVVAQYAVNNANQLTGTVAGQTFPVKFAGSTNEPSNVTVGGVNAGTNTQNWSAEVPLGAGAASVEIRATETTNIAPGKVAQTRVRQAQVNLTATPARVLTYDGNGSTLGDGVRTYEWDAGNRLRAVVLGTKRTEFSYDGSDRWVRLVERENGAVVGSRELIWEGIGIAQVRLKNAAGAETERRTFYGGGEVRTVGATATTLLATHDHLGSVRELVDVSGAIRARYDYDPYGKRTKLGGDLESDQGYTGHYEHAPSGLTLAPFRAYDTELGRWISRDPIEEGDGTNLYRYVANNPGNYVDPSGEFAFLAPALAVGIGMLADWAYDEFLADPVKDFIDNNFSPEAQAMVSTAGDVIDIARCVKNPARAFNKMSNGGCKVAAKGGGKNFDQARRAAFEKAGMTNPSDVKFTKVDPKTGTVVEFKGKDGAKVAYDGPHHSPGPHHDSPHVGWQTGGKRSSGGTERGNIPYKRPQHPSRSGTKGEGDVEPH